MTSLFMISLLSALCILYAIFAHWQSQSMKTVEAGSTGNPSDCITRYSPITSYDNLIIDNKKLSAYKYICLSITGSCMKKVGINPGDVGIVRKFDKKFTLDDVKSGDILLIWLNDSKFKGFKMRIFESKKDAEYFKTYYYDEQGEKKYSTSPHHRDSIKGVFQYIIDKEQMGNN